MLQEKADTTIGYHQNNDMDNEAGLKVEFNEQKGAIMHIETDLDCRILRYGKEIGTAKVGEYTEVKIPKGRHKLEFVGLESSADRYECLITVEDIEFEDYIEVKLLEKYNTRKEKADAEHKAREDAEQKRLAEDIRAKRTQTRIEAEERAKVEKEERKKIYLVCLMMN